MKIQIILLLLLVLISCKKSEKNDSLIFNSDTFNYGVIKHNSIMKKSIKFNVKESNTIITNAFADCGCTKVIYPKNNLDEGDIGSISFVYDTKLMGYFIKRIFIYTNSSKKPIVLFIEGEVKK